MGKGQLNSFEEEWLAQKAQPGLIDLQKDTKMTRRIIVWARGLTCDMRGGGRASRKGLRRGRRGPTGSKQDRNRNLIRLRSGRGAQSEFLGGFRKGKNSSLRGNTFIGVIGDQDIAVDIHVIAQFSKVGCGINQDAGFD